MGTREGLDRLVSFLDAIVAIAVTLLVLPLADLATKAAGDESLGHLMRTNSARIYTFLLSFVVIGRLWLGHHRLFRRVVAYDDVVLLCSLFWALTIAFLPFPTELLAVYGSDRRVIGLYIGVLLLNSLSLTALSLRVVARPGLGREGLTAFERSPAPSLAVTGWLAVALSVGVLLPSVNYKALLLLLLAAPTTRLWFRYRQALPGRTPPPAPRPSSTRPRDAPPTKSRPGDVKPEDPSGSA